MHKILFNHVFYIRENLGEGYHMIKKILMASLVIITLIVLADFFIDDQYNSVEIRDMKTIEKGKVREKIIENEKEYLKVEILTGTYKEKYCIVENIYHNSDYYNKLYEVNNTILLTIDASQSTEKPEIELSGFARDKYELYLVIAFLALLVLVGKKQGIKSAVSLIITITIVIKLMLPLILNGHSPIFAAIVSCIIVTVLTLFIIIGVSSKSIATIIGTSIGVITAGVLAYIIGNLSLYTGLSSHEAASLMFLEQESAFDFTGILFAGIIIGTLGAVMDVSMSISSSMNEIKENNPDTNRANLIKAGMNIGKDIMGTMTNTLILAYTGTSIPLLLFFVAKHTPLILILNTELISTEIIRALSGSIGLIISIPATSIVAGLLLDKKSS